MTYTLIKAFAILAVAGAIAVSAASADARTRKKQVKPAGEQTSQSFNAGQPQRYIGSYDRYNLPPGGGINFNDGRQGANYNGGG